MLWVFTSPEWIRALQRNVEDSRYYFSLFSRQIRFADKSPFVCIVYILVEAFKEMHQYWDSVGFFFK